VAIEDQRLLAGITRFGPDNWAPVAAFVGNGRTRSQCAQRWNRGINPSISKEPWTVGEEEELKRLVKLNSESSWHKIAGELGNRSDVQCRYHYIQMQKGKIEKTHRLGVEEMMEKMLSFANENEETWERGQPEVFPVSEPSPNAWKRQNVL
jgi:hypothetical protein